LSRRDVEIGKGDVFKMSACPDAEASEEVDLLEVKDDAGLGIA